MVQSSSAFRVLLVLLVSPSICGFLLSPIFAKGGIITTKSWNLGSMNKFRSDTCMLKGREEYAEYKCPGAYQLPRRPDEVYPDDFTSWDDFLGVMRGFEEARQLSLKLGLKSEDEWRSLVAKSADGTHEWFDDRIPASPDKYPKYKEEWQGWQHWLGY